MTPTTASPGFGPTVGTELDPRVIETHTAIVFFVGDRAYKLKKAADLGFLDHRSRTARRAACEQEVDLNRRLAPDVYLGVLDVIGPDQTACDHLVAMRRLPDERRLSNLLGQGEDLDGPLRAIAHALATLHARSPRSTRHEGEATADAVARRWDDGFRTLGGLASTVPGPERLPEIEHLVRRYLAGRRPLFRRRIDEGRIRDGHGDLQADDIFVLDDGPRILDCIEFGPEYRWGDVLADLAFLAMDLERLGRADLAERLLALHGELDDDHWPPSLGHHYVAYRAHVRAKVVTLRAAQTGEDVRAEVDRLLDLALAHLRRAEVRLLLVGGLPGTGKSTVAAGLAEQLGAVVLRTDEVRRTTTGLGRRYDPAAVEAVYDELLDQAEALLGQGTSVVLDATWTDQRERSLARAVAERTVSELSELRCTLPDDEAARRIERRRSLGADPSEATAEVAAALASRFDPWPEARTLTTAASPADVLGRAAELVTGRSGPDHP